MTILTNVLIAAWDLKWILLAVILLAACALIAERLLETTSQNDKNGIYAEPSPTQTLVDMDPFVDTIEL